MAKATLSAACSWPLAAHDLFSRRTEQKVTNKTENETTTLLSPKRCLSDLAQIFHDVEDVVGDVGNANPCSISRIWSG